MTAAMAITSFTRAFSTRRSPKVKQESIFNQQNEGLFLGRAASQRNGRPVLRTLISSPVTLISTSNLQVHDAQTIAGTAPIEMGNVSSSTPPPSPTATSGRSSFEEGSERFWSAAETDTSSLDGMSPATSVSERDEIKDYFPEEITPKIPQRAASHSKKAHEGLHRKRSFQRMSIERQQRTSTEIFKQSSSSPFADAPSRFESNPFSAELEQLDEVAEEFGQVLRGAELEAERSFMESHDLACLPASDYILDIHSLLLDLMQEDESSFEDFGGFF